ncbi:MAG: DUF4340 domain-containing protein [Gemmataceae bacterium]
MNLRNTAILFALFFTTLWLFGVMVATKQPAAEEGFLLPTLKSAPAPVIDSITVERHTDKAKDSFALKRHEDVWTLEVDKLATTVDTSRVRSLIERFRNARNNPDADSSASLAKLGLEPPRRVITLKGRTDVKSGKDQTWTLRLGNESADKIVVYALSDERPGKVFAINFRDIEPWLMDNPVSLKSQLFFNFNVDESFVQKISVVSPTAKLALSRTPEGLWHFDEPRLGYALLEAPPPAVKEIVPKAKLAEVGVKALIADIRRLRVREEGDFLPLGKESLAAYGLEDGKESMRITVISKEDVKKKETTREEILIGKAVTIKDKDTKRPIDMVYVRVAGDSAVTLVPAEQFKAIRAMMLQPEELRSRALAFFQPAKVHEVTIEEGKRTLTLLHDEKEGWQMKLGAGKPLKAGEKSILELAETLKAKQLIDAFLDEPKDGKKADAEQGFDAPQLTVTITEEVEGDKKKFETTRLLFGKTEKGSVFVKRILPSGEVSRFQVAAAVLKEITGDNLETAFRDPALPPLGHESLVTLAIQRGGSPVELQRDPKAFPADKWLLKDPREPSGHVAANPAETAKWLRRLIELKALRWVKPLAPKEDLSPYGLDKARATVTLTARDYFAPANLAGLLGFATTPLPDAGIRAAAAALAQKEHGPPSTVVTLRLGKDTGKEGEGGVFASRSDVDAVFVLPAAMLRELETADFRDQSGMFALQPAVNLGILAGTGADPHGVFLLASPLVTGRVQAFEPAQVKEVKLILRTPAEVRQLTFARAAKDKSWTDKSGLLEFSLDSDKVEQFVKELTHLEAQGLISITGPVADQKLTPKDATLRVEATLETGETVTLTIGAGIPKVGFFAQTSAQPGMVFVLAPAPAQAWLQGPAYFAKERVAGK